MWRMTRRAVSAEPYRGGGTAGISGGWPDSEYLCPLRNICTRVLGPTRCCLTPHRMPFDLKSRCQIAQDQHAFGALASFGNGRQAKKRRLKVGWIEKHFESLIW